MCTESCKPKRRRLAFTLVELLVVIGIIALLISILLPALSKAQQQAQLTVCMSNMRSLGQAVAIYQAENHGAYPSMGANQSANHINAPHVWSSLKFGASSSVRYCPTVVGLLPLQDLSGPNSSTPSAPCYTTRSHISYLYSTFLGGWDTQNGPWTATGDPNTNPPKLPCTYRSIPASSDTLMFMEYPQLAVVDTQYEDAGMDRGMVSVTCDIQNPMLWSTVGVTHQVFHAVAPVHFRKPVIRGPGSLTITSATLGSVRTMQGLINVCYADGSVRSASVRQGQQGLPSTITRGDVGWILDMSTQNGAFLPGSPATIPNTRYDPFLPW